MRKDGIDPDLLELDERKKEKDKKEMDEAKRRRKEGGRS